ncbi:MAG: toll/interleukin-1 receptor domain-containing protein [Verrucomicrobiota bacterium]|jgi:hypothetical protein
MSAEAFTYDIFLSHGAKDKPVVRPLAGRLRADGLKVWFDEWELKPGVNLHLDGVRINAIDGGGANPGQHANVMAEARTKGTPQVGRRDP